MLYAESQPDPNAWSFWLKLYLQGGGDDAPPLTITFFEHSAGAWRPVEDSSLSAPRKDADFSRLLDPAYAGVYWGWHIRVPRAETPRVLKFHGRQPTSDAVRTRQRQEGAGAAVPLRGAVRWSWSACHERRMAASATA